jgi:hypothetical protein
MYCLHLQGEVSKVGKWLFVQKIVKKVTKGALDRRSTFLVLCVSNALLIYGVDGGSVFVLIAGIHLSECIVCQPIRPQYGIFIVNHSSVKHPDHGTFNSPSHCKHNK